MKKIGDKNSCVEIREIIIHIHFALRDAPSYSDILILFDN